MNLNFKKLYDLINNESYKEEDVKNAVTDNFMIIHDNLVLNVNLLQYACLKKNIELVKMFDLKKFEKTDDLLKFVRVFDLGKDIYDYLSSNFKDNIDDIDKIDKIDNKYIDPEMLYKKIVDECEKDFKDNFKINEKCILLKKEDLNKLIEDKNSIYQRKSTYLRQVILQNKGVDLFNNLIKNGADPFLKNEKVDNIFDIIDKDNCKHYLPILLEYCIKNNNFTTLKESNYRWLLDIFNLVQESNFTML